jgi:ketosteroid isomerase-like protein
VEFNPETIIVQERAALDRWYKGDPQGFSDAYAQEITYFDPTIENRIDGLDAMRKYLAPITGMIKSGQYEMIHPKVQRYGGAAVLSYNLKASAVMADGTAHDAQWNCTQVYALIGGQWKSIHNHWSMTKPQLKP